MLKSKKVLVFLIFCGLLIVALNVIIFEEENESTIQTKIIDVEETLKVKQGDSYTFDLNINSIEEINNYVSINLSINNKGTKEINISYVYFYLLGKTNNELESSIVVPLSQNSLPDIIQPNSNIEGNIYFNIPQEEYSKLKILVPDYVSGNEEIEYMIKLNK